MKPTTFVLSIAMILVCNTALSQERKIELESIFIEQYHDFGIQDGLMTEFLEISEDQIKNYKKYYKKYKALTKQIIDSEQLSLKVRKKLLFDLIKKRTKEFENQILTKTQKGRLSDFFFYECINQQGFTMSLVYGLLASHFNLSGNERQRIYDSIPEIHEQYLIKVRKAQRKALQKILAKLPKDKQKAIKKRLNAMAGKKGFIWDIGIKHFTTRFGFQKYHHFGMTRIDEDE